MIFKICTDPASEQVPGDQKLGSAHPPSGGCVPPVPPRLSGSGQDEAPTAHHWGPREKAPGNREVLAVNTQVDKGENYLRELPTETTEKKHGC